MEMKSDRPQAASKLLLVDDNHTYAQVVSRALTRRGFEVAVAHDATSALNLVDGNTIYAIVDVRPGDPTGLDLLTRFKRTNPSMRILVLSSYASVDTVTLAIQLGASCCLTKLDELDTIVAALLNE